MPDARAMIHPTTKRYVIISPSDKPKGYKGKWSVGTVIRINPNDYRNYIAARILIPFDSAITNGQFDPATGKTSPQGKLDTTPDPTLPSKDAVKPEENKPEEPKKATPAPKTPTSTPDSIPPKASTKKTVISNPLKDSIQAKKKQIEADKKSTPPPSAIDADKLAAIKAGGKK